jgi:hypothetical protein
MQNEANLGYIKYILFCSLRFGFALHCFLIFFVRISLSGYFFFLCFFVLISLPLFLYLNPFVFFCPTITFFFLYFLTCTFVLFFSFVTCPVPPCFSCLHPSPLAFVVMTFACLVCPFSSASCAFPSGWQHG